MPYGWLASWRLPLYEACLPFSTYFSVQECEAKGHSNCCSEGITEQVSVLKAIMRVAPFKTILIRGERLSSG